MVDLFRSRIHSGTWAVLVILAVLLLQESLSANLAVGRATPNEVDQFLRDDTQNSLWLIIKFIVFVPTVLALILDRRSLLRIWILIDAFLLTAQLLASVLLLMLTLSDTEAALVLIRDTIIVLILNVLIFSLWYWLFDSPFLQVEMKGAQPRWDWLFPQRASAVPGYENWQPQYLDYVFLAVVTSTASSPTDTLPLSRRSKMLMATQIVIAFATITVLAARALSILR